MKRTILTSLLAICISLFANSQTTWDEYNYCKGDYKNVLANGADIKKGYSARLVYEKRFDWANNEYATVWVRSLTKTSTKKIVAYIVIYQLRDKANNQDFYCVPHPGSDPEILSHYRGMIEETNKVEVKTILKLWALLCAVSASIKW